MTVQIKMISIATPNKKLKQGMAMNKIMFGDWTESVENFVKNFAEMDACKSKGITQNDLTTWMETEGAMLFQKGQADYFERVKELYVDKNVGDKIFNVKFNYAYVQIEVGFNTVYGGLLEKFPEIAPKAHGLFLKLKEECLSEEHYAYIAARAVLTEQMERKHTVQKEKNITPDKLKDLDAVIDGFKSLIKSSNASIESMNAFRSKIQPATVSRSPASPLMYKSAENTSAVSKRSDEQLRMDSVAPKSPRN